MVSKRIIRADGSTVSGAAQQEDCEDWWRVQAARPFGNTGGVGYAHGEAQAIRAAVKSSTTGVTGLARQGVLANRTTPMQTKARGD
jgi:hypothetical protein